MTSQTDLACRIVQYRYGDPHEVLQVEEGICVPALAEGEALVRISRSIIHPGDLQLVAARYSQVAPTIPDGRVPGLEGVGVLEDAAPHALDGTGITVGSRVAFFAPGAWQSRVAVSAGSLVAVPDDLPDSVATQILINTITARHVLRTGLLGLASRPRYIVQTGAASAVGKLITAFAHQDGFDTVRLVRSKQSALRLSHILPSGEIIDTATEGWQAVVHRSTQGDIPLAVDGVGGPLVGEIGALLNIKGRMVSYGLLGDAPADLSLFVPKALSVLGATIGTWGTDATIEEKAGDMRAAIEIGRSAPKLFGGFREFDLAELDAAITAVTAQGKTGNIILKF